MADNDDLRAELDMYKSVAVPQDIKPRTTITRVTRPAAATSDSDMGSSMSASAFRGSQQTQGLSTMRSTSRGSTLSSVPELPSLGGDMTLDEIM